MKMSTQIVQPDDATSDDESRAEGAHDDEALLAGSPGFLKAAGTSRRISKRVSTSNATPLFL